MIRVGLTGGIASGKTLVCRLFEARGCIIIDADRVAHRLILRGQPGYHPIVEAFGSEILRDDGEIDRKRLGAVVFSDQARLNQLNGILHPRVTQAILRQLEHFEEKQPASRVIVDASLMIESGFHTYFQRLILVTCTLQQQIDRLRSRNGLSEEQARQRIGLQMPLAEKIRFAHHVIDNSSSVENTSAQVEQLFQELQRTIWTTSH